MIDAGEPPAAGPIRLALRVEGQFWVAYMAMTDTMEGALEIGRIQFNGARAVEDGMDRWKRLMVDVMAATLISVGATPTGFEERAAPESERSGSA